MEDIFQGSGGPISKAGFQTVADSLNCGTKPAPLWAILAVETRGFGFLPDKRPKILFERHVFHKRTGGRFSASNPDISNSDAGGYIGGAAEYQRLKRAMLLDRKAALESASWGLGQVMGFNAASIGYASAEAMVEAFKGSEDAQLEGCARFINATPALRKALEQKDWPRVAFFYNGKHFRKNKYDEKLRAFNLAFEKKLPEVEIRGAQARLTYLGFNPRGIDGFVGSGTLKALAEFQKSRGLKATSGVDDEARQQLRDATGL
jgi:hypothetical protein